MSNDRDLEAADRHQQKVLQEAREYINRPKSYTVIVIGVNENKPFEIKAADAQERSDKMAEKGINLNRANWAAGYVDDMRVLQLAGNNDEAKQLVKEHLQRRR